MRRYNRSSISSASWREGGDIRYVNDGGLLFVAADLCRALRYKLNNIGAPNVTAALLDIRKGEKHLVELEVAPGTYSPYSRHIVIDMTMTIQLIARAQRRDPQDVANEPELRDWLARIVRE